VPGEPGLQHVDPGGRVAVRVGLPRGGGPDAGWRAGLRDLATSDLATFRAHPWLLEAATSRIVFGPHVLARYEAALALLDRLGLAVVDVAQCVGCGRALHAEGGVGDGGRPSRRPQAPGAATTGGSGSCRCSTSASTGASPRLAALKRAGGFAVPAPDAERVPVPYTLQRALDRFAFGLDLVRDASGARIG
jgi:Tetracyclin repressor-like, C-terminal domain